MFSFELDTNAPRQVLTKSEYNINIIQYPSLTAIKEEERSELKSDESLQKITVEDPAPDGGIYFQSVLTIQIIKNH